MIKQILQSILIAVVFSGYLYAHSGKPRYHVIIDTDGAVDDMRAISMLLSGNDIRVLAITSSQGTLLPDPVYMKVKSLLSVYHHEGIRAGMSEEISYELPVWAPFAQDIVWGNPIKNIEKSSTTNSIEVLNETIENYNNQIILIALGSLKTYADWINANPGVISKIERIIWYNNLDVENGFNYRLSPESYETIRRKGIPLDIVGNISDKFPVDNDYLKIVRNVNSIYAKQIALVHSQPEVSSRINQKHLQLWDDLVPLYLTVPILFDFKNIGNIRHISLNKSVYASIIYEAIGKILESTTNTNNRVFKNFPIDSLLYKPEYASIMNSTIEENGLNEWKAICMTNEIHGHTGIYSIIGAKMGIRAMNYFNVGINSLSVTTFAGNKPPLSCLNDGIQISTGATIGQGLITIADSISIVPSAIFEFNNNTITISLKTEIAEQMRDDIKYGIQHHGLQTEQYWEYIEHLAIEYWRTYNRNKIFTIGN